MSDKRAMVGFGELLMRLDTPGHERILQADSFQVNFTGGEANVAVALSQWGIPTRIVSRVPDHDLGTACLNHFRRYGVSTEFVLRGGDRLGQLFVETGASQRSSRVIYDRLHTSFRTAEPGAYDWNRILDGAGWFHFTGTAPALGESVLNPLKEGIRLARQRGIPVSFDCSYRSALWSIAEAAPVFQELLHSVDVFFGSESDAQQFFGIQESGSQALKALAERYDLKLVAFSSRSVTPHGLNTCEAMVGNQNEVFSSRSHEIDPVDRIGAGDALAAAVIRGMLLGEPVDRLAEQAICAAVLKHSIPGDFALLSWDEIQQLVNSSAGTASTRGWR